MSLADARSVDSVGVSFKKRLVTLAIADEQDWESVDTHILLLQNKIDAYLDFIESGEVWHRYPEAKGFQLLIKVFAQVAPPSEASAAIKTIEEVVEGANCSFIFQVGIEDT